MASMVKFGDAAAAAATLGSGDRPGKAHHHSQPCKLQNTISSRPTTQGTATAMLSSGTNAGFRGSFLVQNGSKAQQAFRAMSLPLDRKSGGDASESSVAQEGEIELGEEPWRGAVMFRRSHHRSHYEFQTSLERLGLGFLSTESSRALAKAMGLHTAANSAAPSTEECTPVSISIDVSRDEDTRDLRLDGIARTTTSLCCNRCLAPIVERIFASFNLLLTEQPVDEPTQQRLGVVLGDNVPEDEGNELDLDLDDKLHFPREVKEIDLSKYLRDSVHLEIPYKSLCSVRCAGLCLTCGVNLNERTCNCKDANVKPSWGPLEELRRQLKEQEGLQ